ncbi:hypothetical protein [Polyangium sorediatum]|uniref:Uncharacterized protein n=1 Tax=Polyangium sorediatum TaxID=889274 RepID=A0ABT6P775_9BACT|nr:hypothetical protein [Polyangium sorediatum]MDI1436398.1 hypothetical protein [Polyangium sorediatum]
MASVLCCHAVVVRSHGVGEVLPWPHWRGALFSEEARADFVPPSSPTHPYRREEGLRTITLTGAMDPLEVGTVMAAIALYGLGSDDERGDTAEVVAQRLLSEEKVVVAGGLEITCGGALVLAPECCTGLENWREWITFAEGGPPPWGGHDPTPYITRLDGGSLALGYHEKKEAAIEVAPAVLRAALAEVEAEVAGFAALLERWAETHVPAMAAALVDKLARDLSLRAPR